MTVPPRTNPLVAMAEVERPVMVVTTVAMRTIKQDRAAQEKNHSVNFENKRMCNTVNSFLTGFPITVKSNRASCCRHVSLCGDISLQSGELSTSAEQGGEVGV